MSESIDELLNEKVESGEVKAGLREKFKEYVLLIRGEVKKSFGDLGHILAPEDEIFFENLFGLITKFANENPELLANENAARAMARHHAKLVGILLSPKRCQPLMAA